MSPMDYVSIAFLSIGAFFFIAGSVGVVRFPDVYTRIHALTKADNLGLGFVIVGLALRTDSWIVIAKTFIIWGLVIAAGATSGYLVAEAARTSRVRPWRKP
ncbi:MAG: monovalent cation/H(+) antiporter subunit G [Clostridiales bacterium]|nr:monovalent cation/H(+) antiporter subunit G [Clostridiales bacterium]